MKSKVIFFITIDASYIMSKILLAKLRPKVNFVMKIWAKVNSSWNILMELTDQKLPADRTLGNTDLKSR